MILPNTGEVIFLDGLHFHPHGKLPADAPGLLFPPVPGWSKFVLGPHPADRGEFQVEVVCDAKRRVRTVAVSHQHPFYQPDTPGDAERRAFHEGVIGSDLRGQREFSWGYALLCMDEKANRNWLVVFYSTELHVPLGRVEGLPQLFAREALPASE